MIQANTETIGELHCIRVKVKCHCQPEFKSELMALLTQLMIDEPNDTLDVFIDFMGMLNDTKKKD